MNRPPVILDNGTGFTKMGYAGNNVPNYIIPTHIQVKHETGAPGPNEVVDLDFFIGEEVGTNRVGYDIVQPIRHGIVDNWDSMEKYWQRCLYEYMRCDPEEHYILLTEPPMNTPENREYTAEVMFETFNVPGLYIAVQAVLALCAAILTRANKSGKTQMTGTVIDSGDGVTHVIPVVEGYVIGSCIKHIPLAGRTVTDFVLNILRDRGEKLMPEDALQVARIVKEKYTYVCPDIVKEYKKYDEDKTKFRQYKYRHAKSGADISIDIGYERFLGPELFFSPEIFSSEWTTPLPEVVDQTIQSCPIDCRRDLYSYITLSGGSTMFKNFTNRLERDIRRKATERYDATRAKYPNAQVTPVNVNVISHDFQRFAVWFGGSMLASQAEFLGYFHTKAAYEEHGPRVARHNAVFASL